MKNIFKFMMVAAAASMFAACDETPIDPVTPEEDETPKDEVVELNQNLEFTLEVTTLEADNAKVSVSNNGTTADTWYGFVTSEVGKTEASLIDAEVATLTAGGGKITGLKKQTSTTLTVRGLEPDTDYKYIVFGLSENGEVYGKSQSVSFKTLKGELQYTENSAWTVKYEGAGTIGNYNYEHTISVASTDNNYYFVTAATVEDFNTAGIKSIAESNLAELKAYIDGFNAQNGTNYKVVDVLFKGNGLEAVNLEAGDWYGIAIGVDEKGELTGLYAKSDVITIVEEEMTEEYAAWIGDWTFTGANGAAYNITLEKKVSNKTYNMYGYDGNDLDFIPVEVSWIAEYGIWTIYPQNFGEFEFADGSVGTIYFLGGMETEKGFSLYTDVPTCLGGTLDDGSMVVYGYSVEEEGIAMSLMCHFVVIDGSPFFWADPAEIPTFPISVTPGAATAAKSMAVVKDSKKISTFSKMPKALKVSDFEKAYLVR